MQHALRAAGLGGDGPARQRVRAISEQHAFGGVEQLLGAAVDAAGGSFQMDFTALTLTATRS